MKHNYALCLPQKGFGLAAAVQLAQQFAYAFPKIEDEKSGLSQAVDALLEKINPTQKAPSVKSF